jgi:PAS domain S-box-containing protein
VNGPEGSVDPNAMSADAGVEAASWYRSFFEEDPAAVFASDADGRILGCNPAFVRLFGFADRAAALLANAVELWESPADRAATLERLRAGHAVEYREERCRRIDGGPLPVGGDGIGIFDEDGRLVQTREYLHDLTDRKRREAILVQTRKMEAVGRLAGGIAHDFNNMLMIIQGFTDILTRPSIAPETRDRALVEIRTATARAAALTRQLLAFSRKQVFQLETFDLNALVEDTGKTIRPLIGEDVDLALALAPGLPWVRADRGQLVQVLKNLAENACEAMPRGGRLVLRTAVESLGDDARRERPYVRPGRYVLLQVADTGTGIDAGTMGHLFEPFSTTKEKGKGTGLGLATVYGIVKQSEGFVWATSGPGPGATFSVYLPAAAGSESSVEAPGTAAATPTCTGRILLVEDEEKVREILAEILTEAGYQVRTAAERRTALEMALEGDGFDLVITDVVMPGMRGTDLADELRRRRPGTRIVFISGYPNGATGEFSHRMTGGRFLQKPIGPQALREAVRAALEECR